MFNGRYGADKFGYALTITSIILTLIAWILSAQNFIMRIILLLISAVTLGYAIYRMLSKNRELREKELAAYKGATARVASTVKAIIGSIKSKLIKKQPEKQEDASQSEQQEEPKPEIEFRHFKCPKCKKHLKVPADKGYIKVSCPACGYKFIKRT